MRRRHPRGGGRVNFRERSRRREEGPPDLTPLIDVMFLLLIFFLVTAAFAREDDRFLPIDLPDARTGEQEVEEQARLTLTLVEDGSVLVRAPGQGDAAYEDEDELRALLAELLAEDPDRAVFLRGDERALYGRYIGMLDLLREIGFRRVISVVGESR